MADRSKLPTMAWSSWLPVPTQEPFRSHPESIHRKKTLPSPRKWQGLLELSARSWRQGPKTRTKDALGDLITGIARVSGTLCPEPGAETMTCSLFYLTITFCFSHLSLPYVLKLIFALVLTLDFCFSAYTRFLYQSLKFNILLLSAV